MSRQLVEQRLELIHADTQFLGDLSSSTVLPSLFSRSEMACSICFAFWRMERGIQSMERSSSNIAPRTARHCVGLELDSPVGVELVDRVDKTEDAITIPVVELDALGPAMEIFPATYFTSGAYLITK